MDSRLTHDRGLSTLVSIYKNCDAVRAAGKAPILIGDPNYSPKFDGDHDGIGCEVGEHETPPSPVPSPSSPSPIKTTVAPTPIKTTSTPTKPATLTKSAATVVKPAAPTEATLPVTGSGTTWAIVGALLLAMGVALVVATKRRISH